MKNCAILAVLLLLSVSSAGAVIWDPYVNVDYAYEGDETLTLFNLPDRTGSPFTEAHLPDGTIVDATLRIQLMDGADTPIPFFPREDIWLESADDQMIPCIGGTCADVDTDENGWTYWVMPLGASGFSETPLTLIINGMVINGWQDLNLHFNSADINSDGSVNLVDIQLFASSYFGDYSFEADFYSDGVINLLDVGLLAIAMGSSCP